MNVLHCVSSLEVGGAEKCVKNLAIEQNSQSINVAILSFGNKGDAFQAGLEEAGIKVFNIEGKTTIRIRKIIPILQSYSTIHIHSPAVIRAFTPLIPFLLRKNVVYTLHGEVEPPLRFIKLAHRLASLYLDKCFAVSAPIKQGITARYGWSEKTVSVIQNGVTVAPSPTQIGQSAKIRLCVVCRLIPLKNIIQVIDSFQKYELSRSFQLDIFGEGPEKENLEKKVIEFSLEEDIKFHGNVLDENSIYKFADILLINSTTEGLPMSLIEAMARGIPAVSTNVGNINTVISHLDNGCIYEVDDMVKWHNCLTKLDQERAQLQEMGINAYNFISTHFSISTVSSIYQKYYS